MRVVLALVLCLFFQTVKAGDIPLLNPEFPTTLDQAKYDKLYPLSVKFCTMTALQRIGESFGGPFAHAVLYFRNACIDKKYSYPQIRKCEPGEETDGVGVSVNKVYANTNWVAIPGRKLFFYGDLPANEIVNNANKDALTSKVEGMNIYQGIKLKEKVLYEPKPGQSETAFKIDQSLDTDFAINWGHNLYCVNIPMNEALLNKGIEFVNVANIAHADSDRLQNYKLQYVTQADMRATGKLNDNEKAGNRAVEYRWRGIAENCAHLAYNMFAAMGLVNPKRIGFSIPNPLTMAVPTDRWAAILSIANSGWSTPMIEAYDSYSNPRERAVLDEHGVLLKHHGVIAEFMPAHSKKGKKNPEDKDEVELVNELFKNQNFLANLAPWNFAKVFNYAYRRPEKIYDLEANLKAFEKTYTRILAGPVDLVAEAQREPVRKKILEVPEYLEGFTTSSAQFRASVQRGLEDVRAKLELLKSGD